MWALGNCVNPGIEDVDRLCGRWVTVSILG